MMLNGLFVFLLSILVANAVIKEPNNTNDDLNSTAETDNDLQKLQELIKTEIITYINLLKEENDDELRSLLLIKGLQNRDNNGDIKPPYNNHESIGNNFSSRKINSQPTNNDYWYNTHQYDHRIPGDFKTVIDDSENKMYRLPAYEFDIKNNKKEFPTENGIRNLQNQQIYIPGNYGSVSDENIYRNPKINTSEFSFPPSTKINAENMRKQDTPYNDYGAEYLKNGSPVGYYQFVQQYPQYSNNEENKIYREPQPDKNRGYGIRANPQTSSYYIANNNKNDRPGNEYGDRNDFLLDSRNQKNTKFQPQMRDYEKQFKEFKPKDELKLQQAPNHGDYQIHFSTDARTGFPHNMRNNEQYIDDESLVANNKFNYPNRNKKLEFSNAGNYVYDGVDDMQPSNVVGQSPKNRNKMFKVFIVGDESDETPDNVKMNNQMKQFTIPQKKLDLINHDNGQLGNKSSYSQNSANQIQGLSSNGGAVFSSQPNSYTYFTSSVPSSMTESPSQISSTTTSSEQATQNTSSPVAGEFKVSAAGHETNGNSENLEEFRLADVNSSQNERNEVKEVGVGSRKIIRKIPVNYSK